MTFSSSGVGSASHWAAERFRISAGFKATHIPFRGGLESLTEVMTGRVDFCCIGISAGISFIKEGKAQCLCVTSLKRSPALPDVITSTEAGYKDSHYNFWNGLLAPAKTPRPIVERLNQEVMAALANPETQKKLAIQGVEPSPVTPAEYDAQMRLEIKRLHQRLGTTIVFVTHDQVEAMTLADRIVVMRDGHILQVGAPMELYEKPADVFTARFIGSPTMNICLLYTSRCV